MELPNNKNLDDKQAIKQAIDTIVNNFTKHTHSHGHGKINIIDALEEFWSMKMSLTNQVRQHDGPIILYEFLETPGPPYICFVTLPGNACFATFQSCATKTEARRSAALIALMNSVFNEHPSRKINSDFIHKSTESATQNYGSPESIEIYKIMLELCAGKSMLEFQQMMTVFQLLHWNGSLKAMKERNCTRDEVIMYYCNKVIDDDMRSQISLDWIAREQHKQGTINNELENVNREIEIARLNGCELRFLKEKRDILLLALYQLDMEINSDIN